MMMSLIAIGQAWFVHKNQLLHPRWGEFSFAWTARRKRVAPDLGNLLRLLILNRMVRHPGQTSCFGYEAVSLPKPSRTAGVGRSGCLFGGDLKCRYSAFRCHSVRRGIRPSDVPHLLGAVIQATLDLCILQRRFLIEICTQCGLKDRNNFPLSTAK